MSEPQTMPSTRPSTAYEPEPNKTRTLSVMAAVMLTIFLAALDQTVVGTAMPRIIADLSGFSLYSWVFTSYMVSSTVVIPIAGKMSDLFGRKALLLTGIAMFLAASALCGLAQNMLWLIICRGLQGLGAGVLMSAAFTAVADLVPPAERGKWQGAFAGVFGLASIIGPLLGGFLTDSLTWRWVFYINLPVGLVASVAVYLLFPSHVNPPTRRAIDFPGAIMLVLALVPLLLALAWMGGTFPWNSPQVLGLLAFSAAMMVAVYFVERRAEEPVIPLELFQNPVVSMGACLTFLTSMAMFGGIIYLPLFVQEVLGRSATASGLSLMPMTMVMVVANVLSGQLLSRTGRYQKIALVGLAFQIVGLFLLSRMGVEADEFIVARNIVFLGIGLGFSMPVFVIAVQNALPRHRLGVGTSAMQLSRSLGSSIGVAVMGAMVAGRFPHELVARLPAAAQRIPEELLARLADPRALADPKSSAEILTSLSQVAPPGTLSQEMLLEAAKEALAVSIQGAFTISLIVVGLAFVLTLFLKEVPLRGRGQQAPDEPAAVPLDPAVERSPQASGSSTG